MNANLLQIDNLSGVLSQNRKDANKQREDNVSNIGKLFGTYKYTKDDQAYQDALTKNFDPLTGELNQKGLIADMYAYDPKVGQVVQQQMGQQDMARQKAMLDMQKTQAEIGKFGAESGKIQAESQGFSIKNNFEKLKTLSTLADQAQDQAGWDKALQYARANGYGAEATIFEAPFSSSLKRQAQTQLIPAVDRMKNEVDQQNADTNRINAGASVQNAGTNQQRANQDYEVNTNKNNIDMYKAENDAMKTRNEIATKGQVTAQDQITNSLNYQKANNELEMKKIKETNDLNDKVQSLNYTNKLVTGFSDTADRLLSMPLFAGGKVTRQDGTTDYLRDKEGKIIPSDSNPGGMFQTAIRKWDPGTNDYKEAEKEYNNLVGTAKGKTMAEFKSAIGSPGPVTDADARNFAAMQNLPDTFDDFVKQERNQQVNALDTIRKTATESVKLNNELIGKYENQAKSIGNQSIQAPEISRPQIINNDAPKLTGESFTASNGYVLMPKMFNRIQKLRGQ